MEVLYPFETYGQYNPLLSEVCSWVQRFDWGYGVYKRARLVRHWAPGNSLLDVGCATGTFLEYMQRREGFTVWGVELNAHAAAYARDRLGVPVYAGTLEEAKLPPGAFDVVTMWDVLEHVFDPLSTAREVRRVLKPGGVFICHVPVLDSLGAHVFGRYWSGYEIPRHTYVWSGTTIKRLMTEVGLMVVGTACVYGSHSIAATSVCFWLRDRLRQDGLRYVLEKAILSRGARLAAVPWFLASDRLGWSSARTFVCQMPERMQ
jgi:2-polyprenyl-3-methyl-5-hydroxy-6-metoxy-1,4-benzoquinol methylase